MIGGDHPVMSGVLVDLDGAEKAILLVLAAHADAAGRCWPSVPRLRHVLGYSDSTIRRALAKLRASGLVKVVEWRYAQRGGTLYRLHLPPGVGDRGTPGVSDRGPLASAPVPPGVGDRDKYQEEPIEEPQGVARRQTAATAQQLDGIESSPPAPNPDPTAVAKSILNEWWEGQTPRPQQPYPAAFKVLTKALRDGWTEADLRRALPDLPTISGPSLDVWRNRRRTNGHRPPNASDAIALGNDWMGLTT